MKKHATKLALRRLTLSQLVKPTGGWTPSYKCFGSEELNCSNSCNSCVNNDNACFSQGQQCTQWCPPDITQGYSLCDCF